MLIKACCAYFYKTQAVLMVLVLANVTFQCIGQILKGVFSSSQVSDKKIKSLLPVVTSVALSIEIKSGAKHKKYYNSMTATLPNLK